MLRRLDRAVLSGGDGRAHERHAHLAHDRAHVREVEVDEAVHGDEVGDALHGLQQHVVGLLEGLEDRHVTPGDRQQPLVRDGDQRVDAVLELAHAVFGLLHALLALEHERLGDDADRERADSLAIRATTGAAPVPVPPPMPAVMNTMSAPGQMLGDLLDVLLGRLAADFGIGRPRRGPW